MYWKESIESIIGTTKLEYQIANYQPNEITTGITYKIEDNLIDLFLESRGVKLEGKVILSFYLKSKYLFSKLEK